MNKTDNVKQWKAVQEFADKNGFTYDRRGYLLILLNEVAHYIDLSATDPKQFAKVVACETYKLGLEDGKEEVQCQIKQALGL